MSSRFIACLVLVGAFSAPGIAHADVIISEIAWMGTDVENGSFCEWVELANTGTESVSLSGWTLKTDDGAMTVALSGSIDGNGYYVITRATPTACPEPLPGVDVDLSRSFGSGLSNAGEILVLASDAGAVETIDASGGWEGVVGGDASLKLTAQRNGDAWVTAVATPRALNATESVVASSSSSTSSGTTSSTKKAATNPVPTLHIDVGDDRIVSTKAHTKYQPIVYDSTGRHIRDPHLAWAFGDGGRHIGRSVEHAYREPGEYLVVVRAQEGYSMGTASFVVIADPADISISSLSSRGVELSNDDTRILDLTRFELVSGDEKFRIPEDTSILPGRQVIFPPEVTGLSTSTESMTLRYPSGEVAFVYPLASSTLPAQPAAASDGTNLMKRVDIPARKEAPTHETTIEAPAQAAVTARAGAHPALLSSLEELLRPLWPESAGYRRLSKVSS